MKKIFTLFGLIVFIHQASAQSWLIKGNTNTNSTINFIGTTDKQALVFKTNGVEHMRILPMGKLELVWQILCKNST